MIKTKTFKLAYDGGSYEFDSFQKDFPKAKIIDTKLVTKTYTENELLVTYKVDDPKD